MWPTNNQRAEQKEEEKEAGQPVVLMTSNCCTWEDSSLYTSSYMLADNKRFRDYNAEKGAGGHL